MTSPLVSVVMNCLNGARYLHEALDSIFSQAYKNWEIIFWDNASSDESGAIAQSYGEKVRYFRSNVTTSLGVARNKAFSQCTGEYIAILDVDDVWLPEKLERQLSLMKANPRLGLVFSDAICFDDKGDRYRLFSAVKPKRGKVFGDLLVQNFMVTATMMYRKSVLDDLLYVFDENFTMVIDYDLSLRVAYFHELDYVEYPLSKWRTHSSSQCSKKRFLMPKECQVMIRKLCSDLTGIESQYKKQIGYFTISQVHRQLAFEQWYKGDRSNARKYLLTHIKDTKCLITYLCTWILPFNTFDKIKDSMPINLLRYRR